MANQTGPNGDPFLDNYIGDLAVRGFLHRPSAPSGDGLVITHGASSNCESPILVAIASAFAEAGFTALRCDLPFRQLRPGGPPFPVQAERDRAGLKAAILAVRKLVPGRLFAGGHSYGGRQASMLAATEPELTTALLLLSYPLHPLRRPLDLRTAHFPQLRTPTMFVHGSRDPFGSLAEMREALKLVPAPTNLVAVEGAGHDLAFGRRSAEDRIDVAGRVLSELLEFQSANELIFRNNDSGG